MPRFARDPTPTINPFRGFTASVATLVIAAVFVAILTVAMPVAMSMSAAPESETGEGGASGGQQDLVARGSRDEVDTERQRRHIKQEVDASPGHAWAGQYYEGDGLGANIRMSLAPRSGVAATWHGCMGLYGANRGRVVVESDGWLRLAYALENPSGFGGFPNRMRPVRWGTRRYLIPDEKLMAFVNAIHHGVEPRPRSHGMFLLAEGDESKSVEGLPDLPSPYRERIRRDPIEVSVIMVARETVRNNQDKSCDFTYRITFDRGAADGLSAGIELRRVVPDRGWESATIDQVTAERASAKIGFILEDCAKPKSVPRVGWRFSTGAYRPHGNALARD